MNIISVEKALDDGITPRQLENCMAWHLEKIKVAKTNQKRERHTAIVTRLFETIKELKRIKGQ